MKTYERSTTFKTSTAFMSGSTYVDPSGNMAFIDVYKSDGTYLIQGESGSRTDTGRFHYYISTQSTDPLGLYIVDWYGQFSYGGQWNWPPKHNKEPFNLVKVKQ